MSDPDDFVIPELKHAPIVLTSSERERMIKHGGLALRLDRGLQLPGTDRQRQFVAVCRSQVTPQTDFEVLWIRYKQAILLDKQIAELIDEVAQEKHNSQTLRKSLFSEIEKAKAEAQESDKIIKELKRKVFSYERQLGMVKTESESRDPFEKYSVSGDEWRET